MRVMSDQDAKFKGETLSKFKNEQSVRMGGQKAQIFSGLTGIGFYVQAAQWPLYTQRVPYRLMLLTLGYTVGISLGSVLFGDKSHQVYYTQQEADFLSD